MCRAKKVIYLNMKSFVLIFLWPRLKYFCHPTQVSHSKMWLYFFIFPLPFLPLHFLLPDPHQHSLSTLFIMTLAEPDSQKDCDAFLHWWGCLRNIVFSFFCNIHPNLSPETALLTHPARHPCQPPQVEPQTSPHVCIIVTSVFSLTNDLCFKILARN